MAPDPFVLIIAEIRVDHNVRLTSHLPTKATVLAGQPLHVNLKYRLSESSLSKEAYRFKLSSRIGDQSPADREQEWHDRPILRDDVRGFLGHKYVFPSPGIYKGEVHVQGQYLSGAWGSPEQELQDEASQTGSIEVHVH